MKNDLHVPQSTPIFLGYSKKFDRGDQAPDVNIQKFINNGFIVFNTPPAKLFSLKYLQQLDPTVIQL